jgi:hypothetical protein
MAKRRRRKGRSQANLIDLKTLTASLPKDVQHAFERLARSPHAQDQRLEASPELQEIARRLAASPAARAPAELVELIRRGPRLGDRQPAGEPEPESRPRKAIVRRKRKPTPSKPRKIAGRKRALATKEIKRLQKAYRALRRAKPKSKQPDVFKELRAMLPEDKRNIGDSTLRRHLGPWNFGAPK